MDYYEFMSRANFDCTREVYTKIETVYLNGPSKIIGNDVSSFVKWFNNNGQMKAIDSLYDYCSEKLTLEDKLKYSWDEYSDLEAKYSKLNKDFDGVIEANRNLDRTVSEMMTEKGQLLTENEKLKQKVELYESLLSEEALVNMIVKDMDREGLIRLLMLKQGVKE